jgi:hypothetical protein
VSGVERESRLMMDKEAGAKTRHVAVVVRRFQDICTLVGFCNSSVRMEACRRCNVVWILHVRKVSMLQLMGNTTNLKDG